MKILVLGVGNYLMGDEGVGVHVATKLQKMNLSPEVTVMDGGTGGFHLLEHLETHEKVILIDATMDADSVGTVKLIEPKFASDFPNAMSSHDIGLKDMISALQLLDKLPEMYLVVLSIESLQQQGIELTSKVKNQIPLLCEKITLLIQKLLQE